MADLPAETIATYCFSSLGPGIDGPLSAFNTTQWSGDFIAAGITAISMDVRNLGASDLMLRLAFFDTAESPWNVAASATAITLASGGGWTSVLFPLA